jgi:hypothetical protein
MGDSGGGGGRPGGGGGDLMGPKPKDSQQPGEVFRAAEKANLEASKNQLLDNLRSGKLSQKDAETAANGLLTASMKSRNPEEIRAINKKYAAAMDAIDAYKSERGTLPKSVEKSNYQVRLENSKIEQRVRAKEAADFRRKVPTVFGKKEKEYDWTGGGGLKKKR